MSKHIVAEDYVSTAALLEDLDGGAEEVTAFVMGDDDKLQAVPELADFFINKFRDVVQKVEKKQSKKKNASSQNTDDLVGEAVPVASAAQDPKDGALQYVEPPYPPELFEAFMEVDEVNYRCVVTKATDTVNRGYMLESSVPVLPEKVQEESEAEGTTVEYIGTSITSAEFQAEREEAEKFIEKCNEIIGFEGVLKKGALDYEGIGWAAFEVIRSVDGKIKRLEHVPAVRVRVLKGNKGFVELVKKTDPPYTNGSVVFYLPFGHKVLSKTRVNPYTKQPEPYDPDEDGPMSAENILFNLRDRKTYGKIGMGEFYNSANEILWVPKVHNRSIYYGVPDCVAAAGFIFSKVHIRDFLLQFFENNTVPRYAVLVEGATVAPDVVNTIESYFKTHIKGRAHKTLVLGVPAKGGRTVTVRFEKLQSDEQEGSFQKTRQNDSQGIMVAHGVSPAIIGVHEAASLGSGKGLSQAEIYKDRIVTPNQNLWGRMLTRLLRTGLGLKYIRLKFDPLDIRDREAEQRVFEGYARIGAASLNGIIKDAGLGEPIPGGDRPFIQIGKEVVFIDQLEELYDAKKKQEREEKAAAQEQAKVEAMAKAAGTGGESNQPPNNLNKNTEKNSEKDILDKTKEKQ